MRRARFFTLLLPLALRAEPAAPPPGGTPEPLVLVTPDAKGIFDVAEALSPPAGDGPANPFQSERQARPQVRELTLAVSSVLVGSDPQEASAIINGRPYACGDRIEGMRIEAIAPEGIELREGRVRLRLPVQEDPPRLRLPAAEGAESHR